VIGKRIIIEPEARFAYIRVSDEMNVKLEVECWHCQSKKSKELTDIRTRVPPFITVQVQEEKVENKTVYTVSKRPNKIWKWTSPDRQNHCWAGI
jgi:hypothetical protein